ncbi:MAG: CBS domain-containing protein, partial [Planctomycetota bacterium]
TAAREKTRAQKIALAQVRLEAKAQVEAAKRGRIEARTKAKAEKIAQAKATRRAKIEAKEKAKSDKAARAETAKKAKAQAKTQAQEAARAKALLKAAVKAEQNKEQLIFDIVRRMTEPCEVFPGEPSSPLITGNPDISVRRMLLQMRANDVMEPDVLWGSPDESVQQALAKMQKNNSLYMLIGKDKTPEGIVSKSDLTGVISPYLRPLFAKWRRPLDSTKLQIKLKHVMSKSLRTISEDTPLAAVMEQMCRFRVQCLPVAGKKNKITGLVTENSIFKALVKPQEPIATQPAQASLQNAEVSSRT